MSHFQSRRVFLKSAGMGGAALVALKGEAIASMNGPREDASHLEPAPIAPCRTPIDLSPAEWIWYPSERTLPNTFFLFRKSFTLTSPVVSTSGWIVADSRYLLKVNGTRVQWGPAPSDPRCVEVDPLDLGRFLHEGENTIGVQVLFFGQGDGTHPIGKPGFIFTLKILLRNGAAVEIVSDSTWLTHLARSWRPGQYKRWYVRALQEEFDARLHPYGWDSADFKPSSNWTNAMRLDCPSDKPSICSAYPDYLMDTRARTDSACLQPRSVPLVKETSIPARGLAESYRVNWQRDPVEYFEFLTPQSYVATGRNSFVQDGQARVQVGFDERRGAALTFEFEEQIVGFPYFTADAPSGTIIELMVQEGHTPGSSPLINNHIHSWSRFTCKDGENRFMTFDYESFRWVQLHIHGAAGTAVIRDVGALRREFPWPRAPVISCSEPPLQRLLDACINTVKNSAQETVVDGMGRERQQYSGDGGHQLHAIHLAFGEHRLPARFISTFSMGLTFDGYFLDCWPAYDRLARLMERQLNLTEWGPLLDHSIGFVFDCYYHYMYSGDLDAIREVFPRLERFVLYLRRIQTPDKLLPVENLGVPAVWIDHYAYMRNHQHHKQCAFNLYAAAMLEHAFAPLARALGESQWEKMSRSFSKEILEATIRSFWEKRRGLFVINLPWLKNERGPRLCDRSTATSILFNQCPNGKSTAGLNALVETPDEMGLSYPANACWRLWALAKGGRPDIVLKDLRERWATMDSVRLNNTIGETWRPAPDSPDLWSHCAVVPLYVIYMSIAGIMPIAPGFKRCTIRPQVADLEQLDIAVPTPGGTISFKSSGRKGDRELTIVMPENCQGDLVLDKREKVGIPRASGKSLPDTVPYTLAPGSETILRLRFS